MSLSTLYGQTFFPARLPWATGLRTRPRGPLFSPQCLTPTATKKPATANRDGLVMGLGWWLLHAFPQPRQQVAHEVTSHDGDPEHREGVGRVQGVKR